jgi:hypothetical protein
MLWLLRRARQANEMPACEAGCWLRIFNASVLTVGG